MKLRKIFFTSCAFVLLLGTSKFTMGQSLTEFNLKDSETTTKSVNNKIQFNGYTNHWQNNFTEWHRYGNLFKTSTTDIKPTILQSKIDVADDLNISGLFMQEGFLSDLFTSDYNVVENLTKEKLNQIKGKGNLLVSLNSDSALGEELEQKAKNAFLWTKALNSYQFNAAEFIPTKAFVLENGDQKLFVVSSKNDDNRNKLLKQIKSAKNILSQYNLEKGWFGASTLLKSVTCAQGHPIEIIGHGMNEGNSWFIFDGYMDFLAQQEIKNWVNEVNLSVFADVGFSPIYGCENYDGLQVQDMATKQAWIDYAHRKGGYCFRPVYDPDSDAFEFDGYFAIEGNIAQIDNEKVPFINKTGYLAGNMTSSMVLFIEKDKQLNNKSIWDAIMCRKSVAVFEKANMMGEAKFKNALQLLYLDRHFLEEYFADNIDIQTKVEGYDLLVSIKNCTRQTVEGNFSFVCSEGVNIDDGFDEILSLDLNENKQLRIPLKLSNVAMGKTNPIAVHFNYNGKKKSTVAMLDMPPAISVHQLLYGHVPKIEFPVTVHNFSPQSNFQVEVEVFNKLKTGKPVFKISKEFNTQPTTYQQQIFELELGAGEYFVKTKALGVVAETQLGVGKAKGKTYMYELDLNSDGINEYRMENDSVQVTLLRTGARVIEYIVKSKNDNVLFKIWPEKTYNHKRPFRMRGFYPYGGFEDFLGQASMETHRIYDAKIIKKEGDFVRVEMNTDYFGNRLKKIFTLYGNSPLLEVRFELNFKNPEANVLGPQPILHLGHEHGTEDVFTVPTTDGLKEYRMRPEKYYGQAIEVQEGWNAGYDTKQDITFVGAFPVKQPIFLHMWMNHPDNKEAPHYYVEFQPWTPIIQKSTMYFSYYLWGSGGAWEDGVSELRKRNLVTTR